MFMNIYFLLIVIYILDKIKYNPNSQVYTIYYIILIYNIKFYMNLVFLSLIFILSCLVKIKILNMVKPPFITISEFSYNLFIFLFSYTYSIIKIF